MQAAVLAGGLGTRLEPVTATVPKCLVEVSGHPFLYYLLRLLKTRGLRRVVLLTGYLGEQIEEYFGDGGDLGMDISYSREKGVLMGTGGALKLAEPMLDEAFIVINGDTYLDIDYNRIFTDFTAGKNPALVIARASMDGERSDLEIDRKMMVTRYDKTTSANLGYVNAGVLALRREVLAVIADGKPVSLENEVFPELARRRQLAAIVSGQVFYDIGTPAGMYIFDAFVRENSL